MTFKRGSGDRKSKDTSMKKKKVDKKRHKTIDESIATPTGYMKKEMKMKLRSLIERCDAEQIACVAQNPPANPGTETMLKVLRKIKEEGWECVSVHSKSITFVTKSGKMRMEVYPINREEHIEYHIPGSVQGGMFMPNIHSFDYTDYLKKGTKQLMLEHLI